MELLKRAIELVDENLIYSLVPIVLTLILVELIFKNKFETKKTLNIVRWAILIYTIVSIFYFIGMVVIIPKEYTFINRLNGPYFLAYYFILFNTMVLPFTLNIKKLGTKFWYVLLVAFAIKIGTYYEKFVLMVTYLHRDHLPVTRNSEMENVFFELIGIVLIEVGKVFLHGFIIAILILGVFEIFKIKKTKRH